MDHVQASECSRTSGRFIQYSSLTVSIFILFSCQWKLIGRTIMQINTCNGRYCGDTFSGPNSPNKPTLWTEN